MLSSLVIFHKKNPGEAEVVPQGVPLWSFKTCLRSIHFSFIPEGDSIPQHHDFDIFTGRDAYEFALQVLSGLHSPVVGETEVFGQFKAFWLQIENHCPLSPIFQNLVTDVKKVRGLYLKDLGSQSYGSLVRRLLPSSADVAVIGGGALAQEILPWIYKDKNSICVYVRSPEKSQDLLVKYPRLKIASLSQDIEQKHIVVAAPVMARAVEETVCDKSALVIDLRGESRQDPCWSFDNYKDLSDFFATMDRNKEHIAQAKQKSFSLIEQLSQGRFFAENLHPFGWDDLCAL